MTEPQLPNNIIHGKDLRVGLRDAMRELATLLGQFCGPYAQFAASPVFDHELRPTEYTKDGITILKYTQFRSPEAQFCRNLIGYVGDKVDKVCNDGTTTSMLFASLLATNFLDTITASSRLEIRQKTQAIRDIVAFLEERLQSRRLTLEELYADIYGKSRKKPSFEKFREKVVYWAAMTSTKGDEEISKALTEAALSYPKEFYDHRRVGTMSVEGPDKVIISTQESNFEIEAVLANASIRGNKALGDIFDYEKTYLTVGYNHIADGLFPTQVLSKVLEAIVSGDYPLDRPWFICAPEIVSGRVLALISEYNSQPQARECPIVPVTFYYGEAILNSTIVKAIAAVAGEGQYRPLDDAMLGGLEAEEFMIPCRAKLSGTRFEISDLYEKIEGPYHPFYYDESKERYHTLLSDINDRLAMDKTKKAGSGDRVVDRMLYIKRCLLTQNLKDIMVSGWAHDSAANKSVVTDALGTVIDTLQQGFVLSGFVDLLADVQDARAEGLFDDTTIRAFEATFREILEVTYDAEIKGNRTFADYTHSKTNHKYLYISATPTGEAVRGSIIQDISRALKGTELTTFPIIQPYRGFQAQLIRVGDVIPKMSMLHALMLNAN